MPRFTIIYHSGQIRNVERGCISDCAADLKASDAVGLFLSEEVPPDSLEAQVEQAQ